jgi:hypothetical protein
MAKTYRELNDEEPNTREQYVSGTIRQVKCYFLSDWEQFGDDLMFDYFNIGQEEENKE